MVFASNLGFPRIGAKRELKTALESFWNGKSSEDELTAVGRLLRLDAIRFQSEAGIDFIPSNDFSFYDHVLDTAAMVGAVPKRFRWNGDNIDLSTYFLMARGTLDTGATNGKSLAVPAMDMTKWFDTNYHFIVPELEPNQRFKLSSTKCIDEFVEAHAIGVITRPVLLGPITFLHLARHIMQADDALLASLIDVYLQVLARLRFEGAQHVQIDEPCLSLDLGDETKKAFVPTYVKLSEGGLDITVASYFGPLRENLQIATRLPVAALHLDLVRGAEDLESALNQLPAEMKFSAGIIDGRGVWRCDLKKTAGKLEDIAERLGPERLIVAPSCSLVYVPVDVELEDRMDPDIRQWLAFAKQKVEEVSVLTDALCCGRNEVEHIFESNTRAMEWRSRVRDASANPSHTKIDQITERMCHRQSPYHARRKAQETLFNLPLFPTTTIGSFPQTKEIRDARKKMRSGELSSAEYKNAMQHEITNNIELQEKIGLDVLVHGEPERTDMVEYFADQLDGMLVTQHGWVQSYGSRCVKPPIIHGDISRPKPITVEWATFAQAQTGNPVKGMLTGPVTILQWSFERDDKPPEISSLQLALAIRDEVADLEAAGIKIIQIDEPAIREGLPLRHDDRQEYLRWAIRAFKIASSGVDDDTQIHTHMCYSEFGDMLQSIIDMDADVISIEAARSHMELLTTLRSVGYPNEIGPGVWDVHSPRVPTEEEIEALLKKALEAIPPDRLWVNPDCGLKTRGWKEVVPALNALVQAASSLRHKTKSGLPTASRARE